MNKQDLIALAERVEKAEGLDRGLDALIWCALRGVRYVSHNPAYASFGADNPETQVEFTEPPKRVRRISGAYGIPHAKPWTSSLDAALTLVPAGWAIERWQIWPGEPSSLDLLETMRDGDQWVRRSGWLGQVRATAATPPLALTAACLRAIAEERGE